MPPLLHLNAALIVSKGLKTLIFLHKNEHLLLVTVTDTVKLPQENPDFIPSAISKAMFLL